MADKEHLEILRQGVTAWNKWRGENRLIRPDLRGANLKETNLRGIKLSKADLKGANLSRTRLASARLLEANLLEANLFAANLNGASLDRASLRRTNLSGATLLEADLREANLSEANLSRTILRGVDLRGADLSLADLKGMILNRADLSEAILSGAILDRAILNRVNLNGANLNGASLDHTVFAFTSMASAKGLLSVAHGGPSSIDYVTIARSIAHPDLEKFLIKTGIPDVAAIYMLDSIRSLDPYQLFSLMYSTFISYGGPDEPFATRLHEALNRNNVHTFLFKEHAIPGVPLADVMRTGITEYDRIVVICSKESLERPGVLNELELTMRRESDEGGRPLLIPIARDRYVYDEWKPKNQNLRKFVLERVIGDFQDADEDDDKFDAGLRRLLLALIATPNESD